MSGSCENHHIPRKNTSKTLSWNKDEKHSLKSSSGEKVIHAMYGVKNLCPGNVSEL